MWLLIDNKRTLNVEWIARTAEVGRKLLALGGWECVCFDYDLGGQETGHDVLKWGLERGLIPDSVQLVTDNLVGRKSMRVTLESSGYSTIDGINFYKE